MKQQKEALFHDGSSQFCKYNEKSDTYTFILRTTIGAVNQAFMAIDGYEMRMSHMDTKGRFDYYAINLALGTKMIKYHFRTVGQYQLYYNVFGASEHFSEEWEFEFTPGFKTPDWAKGAVMYQIMVDRFNNGDKSNDVMTNEYAYIGRGVSKVENWMEPPAVDGTRQFYGGDLQGVIDKLEYLEKLGVEVIYFNPIFVSPSNHKYDTQDYDYIDPHFGKIVNDNGKLLKDGDNNNEHAQRYKVRTTDLANLEASNKLFVELVEKAHAHGIKIIIDGVFNHCGSFNKWMDKEKFYTKNKNYKSGAYISKDSPYNLYFKFLEDRWPDNNSFEGWWGFDTLPKLNYEGSKELCDYIIEVGKKWVSPPYNVDGWRLDVAADLGHSQEFNHEFWKKFRKAVKEANPEAIILAEHYGDANSWLQGDQWDTIMNYDGFMDPVTWFLTGVDKHSDNSNPGMRGDAGTFKLTMQYQMSRMQNQSLLVAMNELSNHDHSRFLTRTNHIVGRVDKLGSEVANQNVNKFVFMEAVIIQMTWPGAPTVYYGDEAGVCGFTDPDNRRTYPWGHEDKELIDFHKAAIKMHKENEVLRTGSYKQLYSAHNVIAYGRFTSDDAVIVVVNNGEDEIRVNIPAWETGLAMDDDVEQIMVTFEGGYSTDRQGYRLKDGILNIGLRKTSATVLRRLRW